MSRSAQPTAPIPSPSRTAATVSRPHPLKAPPVLLAAAASVRTPVWRRRLASTIVRGGREEEAVEPTAGLISRQAANPIPPLREWARPTRTARKERPPATTDWSSNGARPAPFWGLGRGAAVGCRGRRPPRRYGYPQWWGRDAGGGRR